MASPIRPDPDDPLTRLALAAIANRPAWLDTCHWCLGVIYQPSGVGGMWQHVHHGIVCCQRPLPGVTPQAMARPLDRDDLVGHLLHLVTTHPRRLVDAPPVPSDTTTATAGGGPNRGRPARWAGQRLVWWVHQRHRCGA